MKQKTNLRLLSTKNGKEILKTTLNPFLITESIYGKEERGKHPNFYSVAALLII
jgi:hypothetical protein